MQRTGYARHLILGLAACGLLTVIVQGGCAESDDIDIGAPGTGGLQVKATGGDTQSGGSVGSGGSNGTGGFNATGGTTATGGTVGTVHALFEHYEEMGDFVIRNLADEDRVPELKATLEWGRKEHRKEMHRQFAPWLDAREPGHRRALLDCLVATCDVYVWKLFRRDMGRSRNEAEAHVRRIVSGILQGV